MLHSYLLRRLPSLGSRNNLVVASIPHTARLRFSIIRYAAPREHVLLSRGSRAPSTFGNSHSQLIVCLLP